MSATRPGLVALDFDGVICDGSRETYVVAARTFSELEASSTLLTERPRLRPGGSVAGHDFDADPVFGAYRSLSPLGNRAEDFGVALLAITARVELPDQTSYDEFRAAQDRAWLDAFHRLFYEHRTALRAESVAEWLRLQPPFPEIVSLLERRGEEARMAIATAKDRESVLLLLEDYGLGGLFPSDLVLDKEVGRHKTAHLTELHRRLGVTYPSITFVDDKVNHLRQTATLGVRPVLAGWGFNTDRELALARALGFPIATLDTADSVIFGSSENTHDPSPRR